MKLTRMTIIIAFGLLLGSMPAFSQTAPGKLELARQLATLLQFDEMFADDMRACNLAHDEQMAAAAYRADPESFNGLTPASAQWHEVEAAYERYRIAMCKYASPADLTRVFAEEFAKQSTEDDMRASIAFYSSPAGKRIQTATREVNKSLQAYISGLMRKAMEQADTEYRRDMREILARFQDKPK